MTTINVRSADPEAQRAAILSNTVFLQLMSATPAQIDAQIAGMTLAQIKPVVSMLAQVAAYLMTKGTTLAPP